MIERSGDFADIGTRAAVGVAGASYSYLGLPMDAWVGIATIIFMVVSTIPKIPDAIGTVRRWIQKWRNRGKSDG